MNIIFFLLVFVVLIVLVVLFSILGFIRNLFSAIFGFGKNRQTEKNERNQNVQNDHKKVFEKTEGEYVDYEEIK
jgi:hypothetical protein